MFAFIIWDMYEKTVFGARDPFGIKPIFYQVKENRFFFSSEKKSLLLLQQEPTLNIEALQHYLTFQYVPEPLTMHTAIKKLEPGHYFIKKVGSPMEIKQYWQPTFHPVHQSEDEFIKQIRDTVYESVKLHTSVDVPIGAFLSGGIDSTLIAAMARQIHPKIKTFSVGFAKEDYSEIQIAKETAAKLNIENISYTITAEEYMKEIPKIIWHLDDPLADPACVPLYFAAKLEGNM